MADNVDITPGTGKTVSAKDIGGKLFQRILPADPVTGVELTPASVVTTDPGASDAGQIVRLPPSENQIGKVGLGGDTLEITLSTDTAVYADGDVLADTQTISNAVRVSGGSCTIQTITVLDKADQGVGLDLIFLRSNVSLGTENSAPNISDANAENIIGRFPINSSSWYDIGGARICSFPGVGLKLKAVGSRDLYIAAISRGTGTYAGGTDLMVKLAVDWD